MEVWGMFGQNLRLSDSKNRHLNWNAALIIDNCPAHPKIDHLTNTTLYFPPPNFQNSAYGLSRNIKNFKIFYRTFLVRKRIVLMEGGEEYEPNLLEETMEIQSKKQVSWMNFMASLAFSGCARWYSFTSKTCGN